ncbi:hypothetical protein [Tindallia californiensis]|uniref:Uncharacterized protein n=1 Tax=Tindallia californiensis TaxID=159292 RepID=A0A1H3NVW5_9FIRM|nr:hypothetical protein [Tindallia californiensis]SDY93004.1 hypothetical protein SAMN05192546_105320 [Tindallia californiensis]
MKEAIIQKLDTTYTYMVLHISTGVIIAASLYVIYLSRLIDVDFTPMLLPLFAGVGTYAAFTYYYQIYRRGAIGQFLKGLIVTAVSGGFIIFASLILSNYIL